MSHYHIDDVSIGPDGDMLIKVGERVHVVNLGSPGVRGGSAILKSEKDPESHYRFKVRDPETERVCFFNGYAKALQYARKVSFYADLEINVMRKSDHGSWVVQKVVYPDEVA